MFLQTPGPIGLFDSGYDGSMIFDKIHQLIPGYDYVCLGGNACFPYGTRLFEVVYQFIRQAVSRLFESGCQLVILACNTTSVKAPRTTQQKDLPTWDPNCRVLGAIRPTVELVDTISRIKRIDIVGTSGTVMSSSYTTGVGRMHLHIQVTDEARPMWVPLVENNKLNSPGADYFMKKHTGHLLSVGPQTDVLILECTHYPLLMDKIRAFLPSGTTLSSQGEHVAESLRDYLGCYLEVDRRLTKGGNCRFLTTGSAEKFSEAVSIFINVPVSVSQIEL